MADNKIVHRVSLEGADKVAKQLESIGDVGEKSFKRVKSAAEGAGDIGKAGGGFGGFGKTEESRAAAEKLREVLHTLHPVLDTAGLGLGNLGAFTRVAGAGLGALGVAIAGSIIVGLAKLSDQADTAKKKLGDLGASKDTFKGLEDDAKKLGTVPEKLTGGLQELLRLRNEVNNNGAVTHPTRFEGADGTVSSIAPPRPPGAEDPADIGAFSEDKLRSANRSLNQILEAGKAEDPGKASQDFFRSLRTNKGLSPDALKSLTDQSYGGAEKFAQSLPQNFSNLQDAQRFLDKGGKVSSQDVLRGLQRVEPDAAKAAEAVRGLSQAFDGLGASFNNLTKSLTGETFGKVLTGQIDKVSHTIDETGKELAAIKKVASDLIQSVDLKKGFTEGLKGGGDAIPQYDQLGNPIGTSTEAPPSTLTVPPVGDFLKKAISDPGALQERPRPEAPPLGFDRSSDGSLIKQGLAPAASKPFEYIPEPSLDEQRRLDRDRLQPPLGPSTQPATQPSNTPIRFGQADAPQQVASLSEGLSAALQAITAALTKQPADLRQDGIPASGGIRGEGETSAAISKVTDLGTAAEDAAAKLRGVAPAAEPVAHAATGGQLVHAATGGQIVDATGGGHLQGPGTGTSDSMLAAVSNKEFVVNAEDTAKNIDLLHDINSGKDITAGHYAAGGQIIGNAKKTLADLGAGDHNVTFDPASGGAIIDGNLYPPGSPILNDPKVKQLIEESKAGMNDKGSQKKYKSDFVGRFGYSGDADDNFAAGGLVGRFAAGGQVGGGGGGSSRLTSIIRGFANGGIIDVPQLAVGGMPEMASPDLGEALQPTSPNGEALHPLTMNFPWGGSVEGLHAEPGAMRQLEQAAIEARTFATGKRPGWQT